jgi:hypothetical protein
MGEHHHTSPYKHIQLPPVSLLKISQNFNKNFTDKELIKLAEEQKQLEQDIEIINELPPFMSVFWVKLQIPVAIITTILLLDSTFNNFNFSKSSFDIFEMGAPGKKWTSDCQPIGKGFTLLKTKNRVTRTPLKTGGELRCSERLSSSCSTSGTRRVTLVTNPVTNHGKCL